ncbi:hypothetical protein [Bacillus sp. EAC]|uniref:hypothetical protein n=1 Tax=Bacillus sp. EAC TaxID=1978338 RepID=UPI000B44E9DD|nr:hypothetical protein [Bacillus sp. EAC]
MKKFFLILSTVPLFFVFNGCQKSSNEIEQYQINEAKSNEKQTLDVRESIWNQLTKEDKKHTQGNWKYASVQKINLRESMGIINDKNFIGKEVYIVDYSSNDNPTIGGFVVYADIKSHKLIGYGYRD